MHPPRRTPFAVPLLVLAAAGALAAQTPPDAIVSGPPGGVPLPKCTVFAPSGPLAGQELDVAARIGTGPGALLFVHELTRNTAPMIGGLDRLATQLAWTGLQAHTVLIAADRNDAELACKRSSDAMSLQQPLLVSVDGAEGPGGYALQRKATLTLVLVNGGQVVRSVAFTDTGRADLPRLRALLEEVAGPVPTEPDALRRAMAARLPQDPERLRALVIELALRLQRADTVEQERQQRQQQRDANRMGREGANRPAADGAREGKAPEDEELRTLLRRCIKRDASATELDDVFAAIAERVGDDAGLRTQAIDMFKLMLSLDYGGDEAKRRAREWLARPPGR